MKKGLTFCFVVLILVGLSPGRDNFIALKGGTFYTITSGVVENGVLLIEDGKIKKIGKNLEIPDGYRIIDTSGKIITPGFILIYSHVGLEGDLFSNDYIESSEPITPQMRAIDAFYPLSKSIPRLRNRGITTFVIFPGSGNVISGQGAIMKTAGKIAEQMAIRSSYGLLFTLGEKAKRKSGMPRTRMGQIYLLKKNLNEARKYVEKWQEYEKAKDEKEKPIFDFKLDPLASLIKGKNPAFIQCYKVQDIMNIIKLSETYEFKIVLVDAQQASQVANEVAKRKIPVLVAPLKSLWWDIEKNTWEPKNAKKLYEAGVLIAIIPGEGVPYGPEELTFYAAYAVRHGLPEDEALKAITINPARILGQEKRIGSLERGKDADIVIMDAHPFKVKTKIEKVFIKGKIFEIEN